MSESFRMEVKDVAVSSYSRDHVTLDFTADKSDLLNLLTVADVVDYFSTRDLLNEIGVEECKSEFGLVEAE